MTLGKSGQKHFKTHIISLSITSIKSLMSLSSNLMTNNLIGLVFLCDFSFSIPDFGKFW